MPTYRTDSDLPNGGSTKNVDVKWDDLGGGGTFNGGGLSTKYSNKTIPTTDQAPRQPRTGLPPVVIVDEWSKHIVTGLKSLVLNVLNVFLSTFFPKPKCCPPCPCFH